MSQQAQWKPAGGAGMTFSLFSAKLAAQQAVWGVQSAAWGACRTVFRAPRSEACLDPVQGTRGCPDSTRDGLPWLHFRPNRPLLPSNQGHSTTEQGHCVTNQGHSVTEQGHCVANQGHSVTKQGHSVTEQGHCVTKQGHCVVSQTYSFGRFRGQQPLTTACAASEAVRP